MEKRMFEGAKRVLMVQQVLQRLKIINTILPY